MARDYTLVGFNATDKAGGWAHARRLLLAGLIALLALMVVAFVPSHAQAKGRASTAATIVGPKAYYLALGDSLAFGYQPNLDWSHGYAQDWSANIKAHGGKYFTNYGCNGEKSSTFINGGCPYWYALHNYYSGSQLNAALKFISGHKGQVSPVSIDIGANDLLPDFSTSTCTVSSSFNNDFATMQTNVNTILSKLHAALGTSGDLVVMTYYNVYANKCPNSPDLTNDINAINSFLTQAAANNGALVANGRAAIPDANVCADTWICSSYNDIHANGTGYSLLAGAFESATGY